MLMTPANFLLYCKEKSVLHHTARNFELSGGNIKNIVLNAVFLAADEDVEVNMLHILESLRMEKLKTGKVMIATDFGEYRYYFEKGEGLS